MTRSISLTPDEISSLKEDVHYEILSLEGFIDCCKREEREEYIDRLNFLVTLRTKLTE